MKAILNQYFPNDISHIILDIHYRTMFYESIDQMKMIMSCYLIPLGSISNFMLIMIEGDNQQRKINKGKEWTMKELTQRTFFPRDVDTDEESEDETNKERKYFSDDESDDESDC